ncbi:MAG: hypothetical protein K6G84_05975 [Lachnospiraceae bacterium]|nr:hypothetical protein [Lachnospiraceae bacterium]
MIDAIAVLILFSFVISYIALWLRVQSLERLNDALFEAVMRAIKETEAEMEIEDHGLDKSKRSDAAGA